MAEFLDVDYIIKKLLKVAKGKKKEKFCLDEKEIKQLCHKSMKIFLEQPMLLEVEAPLKVCGDIHGQYSDMLKLFELGGYPPEANYLFLGDYVDRGDQSLETICLLLAYKCKFPENFFLLRGNHEASSVCRVYGFFHECCKRFKKIGPKIFKTFTDVFNTLPAAAVIDDRIFCCHGGLSPDLLHMSQIRELKRPTDVPIKGLLCDLLWSDPVDFDEDKKIYPNGWHPNDRAISFTFGPDVVDKFLKKHDFHLICRAHMVVEDGYEFFNNRKLVTVFSAPNYCGTFDNAGAILSINKDLKCSFQILTPTKNPHAVGTRTKGKRLKDSPYQPESEPIPEFSSVAQSLRKVNDQSLRSVPPDPPFAQSVQNMQFIATNSQYSDYNSPMNNRRSYYQAESLSAAHNLRRTNSLDVLDQSSYYEKTIQMPISSTEIQWAAQNLRPVGSQLSNDSGSLRGTSSKLAQNFETRNIYRK